MSFYLSFSVPIQPVGKARPRVVSRFGHTHAFTPKKTIEAEKQIKLAAINAMAENKCKKIDVPLSLSVTAFFALPKSATKKRRQEIANNSFTPHAQKPDIDNIVKLVSDALNDVVYFDDKQIVQIKGSKHWTIQASYILIEIEKYNVN